MDAWTFHWWTNDRKPPKWVKMASASLENRPTTLGGLRVDFVAKLKVVGVLPKRVRGTMWLVEEDGT